MTDLRTAAQAVIDNYELRHKFDMDVLINDLRQALDAHVEPDKRIVEPKKVKLLPFAYNDNGYWLTAGFFESIEKAKEEYRAGALIAPINPDGSIEVEG